MASASEKTDRTAAPLHRAPATPGLWLLIAVSAALFISRGLWRATTAGLADFAAPYAGARLLITGDNPYDSSRLIATLSSSGVGKPEHSVAVYPPGSLAALTPFAPFPAGPARWLMIATGIGLLIHGAGRWMHLLSYSKNEYIIATCLLAACSPLHTAMTVSNPALLAAGALLSGTAFIQSGVPRRGLFLLGLSLALKPQLGLIGPLWFMLGGRFRPAFSLMLAVGSLHLAVGATLFYHEPAAWTDWMANLHSETVSGSISAETGLGFQRIDPAGVWFALAGVGLPSTVSLLIAAGFSIRMWQSGRNDDSASPAIQLGRLSAAGLALLLAGYHRSYDALVLIPLWLLLVTDRFLSGPRSVLLIGILSLPWILPGAGLWRWIESRSEFVHTELAPSFLWTVGLLRLHGWVMVVTTLLVAITPPSRLAARNVPSTAP